MSYRSLAYGLFAVTLMVAARPAAAATTHLTIQLPSESTQLYVNGQLTEASGRTRQFVTEIADTEAGNTYRYTLRAVIEFNGQVFDKTVVVDFQPGKDINGRFYLLQDLSGNMSFQWELLDTLAPAPMEPGVTEPATPSEPAVSYPSYPAVSYPSYPSYYPSYYYYGGYRYPYYRGYPNYGFRYGYHHGGYFGGHRGGHGVHHGGHHGGFGGHRGGRR